MGQNLCWYYFDLLWRRNNQPVPICTDLIPPTPSAGGKITIETSSIFLVTKATIIRFLDVTGAAWLDRRHRMPSVGGKLCVRLLLSPDICLNHAPDTQSVHRQLFRMQVHGTLVHLQTVIVIEYMHVDMMIYDERKQQVVA